MIPDFNYYYYCPICGCIIPPSYNNMYCSKHKDTEIVRSKHEREYYCNKAVKQGKQSGIDFLFEEEIMKDSRYDVCKNIDPNHLFEINLLTAI